MKKVLGVLALITLLGVSSCKDNVTSTSVLHVNSGKGSDAFLKNIVLIADDKPVLLNSVFNATLYRYEAMLPYKAKTIKLEALANNSEADVQIEPKEISLDKVGGATCTCVISVVSSNKEVKHRYVVQLNRQMPSKENRASSLVVYYDGDKILPLNEAFYSGKHEYTADIADTYQGKVRLQIFPYSAFASSKVVEMGVEQDKIKIEGEVKAEDEGVTPKKYSVVISKTKYFSNENASNLDILSISYKNKLATYDGISNSFVLYVPVLDGKETIKNGLEIKSYAVNEMEDFDPNDNFETIEGKRKLYIINVHNREGKNRNYKLYLVRGEKQDEGKSDNTSLLKIEIRTDVGQTLSIDCKENRSDLYDMPIHKLVNNIQVLASPEDVKAFVSVSPQGEVPINIGDKKEFTIIVRAENGKEQRYTVNVVKSLEAMVRVLQEEENHEDTDLPFLTDGQKLNYMFTGAFYKNNTRVFPYEIGMYEVNYKLWYDVRNWAELNGYTFSNKGCQGDDVGKLIDNKRFSKEGVIPTPEKQYNPVTGISYRDAIIWCNAYSEMYDLSPVYYFDGKVLRDSTSFKRVLVPTTNGQNLIYDYYHADMAIKDTQSNGYRLPTTAEWEMAARGGDKNAKEWKYAFPGVKGFEDGKLLSQNQDYAFGMIKDYVWYLKNAQGKTHDVGEKKPNSLGIYDMAGNVYEICEEVKKFDNPGDSLDPRYNTFIKGGSWKVGGLFPFTPPFVMDAYYTETKANDFGFRLARTIK